MRGTVASIWRHPVKGLTPERLSSVELEKDACFPIDRLFAVEVGPSGFDPEHPRHISKMRFAVLARFPALARVKTRYDEASGRLHVGDASGFGVDIELGTEEGRVALAGFLQSFLGGETDQKLKVLIGPGDFRFMDSRQDGFVSAINLASVRAVGDAIGREVDPLRFRANIYYEGPEAFAEDELERGMLVDFGGALLRTLKPIERCVATHANPETGIADIDMVEELRSRFGRLTLGTYFAVKRGGRVADGDAIALAA